MTHGLSSSGYVSITKAAQITSSDEHATKADEWTEDTHCEDTQSWTKKISIVSSGGSRSRLWPVGITPRYWQVAFARAHCALPLASRQQDGLLCTATPPRCTKPIHSSLWMKTWSLDQWLEKRDMLGNLALLPTACIHSAGSKEWPEKKKEYWTSTITIQF